MLGQVYATNPRDLVPAEIWAVVRTWSHCRGSEFGAGPQPDPGGINDQAAWLLDAFDALNAADAELRKEGGDADQR